MDATSGLVRSDERLEIAMQIQVPPTVLGELQLATAVSQHPFERRVGGTIDKPLVGAPMQRPDDWQLGNRIRNVLGRPTRDVDDRLGLPSTN